MPELFAEPLDRICHSKPEAKHLVKVAYEHMVGMRGHASIFGTDYETHHGTGVRNHIQTKARATGPGDNPRGLVPGGRR